MFENWNIFVRITGTWETEWVFFFSILGIKPQYLLSKRLKLCNYWFIICQVLGNSWIDDCWILYNQLFNWTSPQLSHIWKVRITRCLIRTLPHENLFVFEIVKANYNALKMFIFILNDLPSCWKNNRQRLGFILLVFFCFVF